MRRLLASMVVALAFAGCTCRKTKDEVHATGEKAASTKGLGAPRVLASGQVQPFGIAVDATHVWWTSKGKTRDCDGALSKIAKSGSETIVVEKDLCTPYGIALDETNVYWTEYDAPKKPEHGRVMRAARSGGPTTVLAEEIPTPWAIAVRDGDVFFTTLNGHAVLGWTATTDGGKTRTIAAAQKRPLGLAVDANAIYWSDADTGVLLRAPNDGSPPALIADTLKKPAEIAIDDAFVYAALFEGQAIVRAPLSPTDVAHPGAAGNVETIASGAFHPRAVGVDDRFVWWVAAKEGVVMRAPKAGGAAETIASGQKSPYSIAVDAQGVYWTNLDDGTVMAVDKK